MKVLGNIRDVQQHVKQVKKEGRTVGFVPTMGYLHEGHLKLIETARSENDIVILSIFVNPLQFGAGEDLDTYPRDEERDRNLAEEHGVDVLFLPTTAMMYPEPMSIQLSVTKRTDVLCGKSRPGHFDGVAAVLTKLFNIVMPDQAYFGMKDAQQVAVVDALINDFNYDIQLVPVATVREEDGLAKSSRNVHLTAGERDEAPAIQESLQAGRQMVEDGERSPARIIESVTKFLESRTRGRIDYIELLSYPELTSVDVIDRPVILAAAVFYEKARLIDNVVFDRNGKITTG
ncbi:pantoate--beta-alanine ligase [Halobacillus kuroshimensis]|uniref:Pantothenate synthetase n=1 Tax=Halobacillus kuroshimensis TaxID=302481 RepID=A0ABS3DTL2_9BACI|nr:MULTISPECIES: pantoate--beta-alanine ligase [Halobacillus]MBN8234655.1 pantoate--beta-alanine ligase [Halobacillus kuroshimensis]